MHNDDDTDTQWQSKCFAISRGKERLGTHMGVAPTVAAVRKLLPDMKHTGLDAILDNLEDRYLLKVGGGIYVRRQQDVKAPGVTDPMKEARSKR